MKKIRWWIGFKMEIIQKMLKILEKNLVYILEEEKNRLVEEVKEKIKNDYNIILNDNDYEIIYFDKIINYVKKESICVVVILKANIPLELKYFIKFICLNFEDGNITLSASETIGIVTSNINAIIKQLEKIAIDVY